MKNEDLLDSLNDPIEESKSSTTVEVPPNQDSGDNKNLLMILAVSTIIASFLAGFFYWQNTQLKGQIVEKMAMEEKSDESIQDDPTTTPDPTADWETYTNTASNFQIKFPQSWEIYNIAADASSSNEATKESRHIEISDPNILKYNPDKGANSGFISIQNFGLLMINPDDPNVEQVVVNDIPMTLTNHTNGNKTYTVIIPDTDTYLEIFINYTEDSSLNITFDQILSTFEFLDANDAMMESTGSANEQ